MPYYAPFYQPNYYNPIPSRQDVNQYNQQYQQPIQQQPTQMPLSNQPTQQTNNGLIWVQGEAGAKSYLVAPGNTVMLMDSENSVFYLKSADASGMPMPLRIFDYKERTNAPANDFKAPTSDFSELDGRFITREEFEQRIASVASQCQCKNKSKKVKEEIEDGESTV